MSIYLDYNSSAPIDYRVLEYMVEVYKNNYGNSDSRTHDYGDNARKIVEDARGKVASVLNIDSGEVFFTSGATESNNIVLLGLLDYANKTEKKHIITTAIEHKSVLQAVNHLQEIGFSIDIVNPSGDGTISAADVTNLVREDTLLVSIMHVNNETGMIQPVCEIGDYLFDKDVYFHVDATQSFGKLVEELSGLKYDFLSFSGHKFGGPQGVGGLILRKKRYKLPPVKSITYGGQQEHGIRPGTIPVALVAGMGKACELVQQEYKEDSIHSERIKKEIIKLLNESKLEYSFNGDQKKCMKNTINICIKGVNSEALMLSSKQFCGVSNGSACNSKSYNPSYVLVAMGISESDIGNSIRISWGKETDLDLVRTEFQQLLEIAKGLVW